MVYMKSSVNIRFKLFDLMAALLVISLSRFGTSIVTVSLTLIPCMREKLFAVIVRLPARSIRALLVKLFAVIVKLVRLSSSSISELLVNVPSVDNV